MKKLLIANGLMAVACFTAVLSSTPEEAVAANATDSVNSAVYFDVGLGSYYGERAGMDGNTMAIISNVGAKYSGNLTNDILYDLTVGLNTNVNSAYRSMLNNYAINNSAYVNSTISKDSYYATLSVALNTESERKVGPDEKPVVDKNFTASPSSNLSIGNTFDNGVKASASVDLQNLFKTGDTPLNLGVNYSMDLQGGYSVGFNAGTRFSKITSTEGMEASYSVGASLSGLESLYLKTGLGFSNQGKNLALDGEIGQKIEKGSFFLAFGRQIKDTEAPTGYIGLGMRSSIV